jgi:hypothetical protein
VSVGKLSAADPSFELLLLLSLVVVACRLSVGDFGGFVSEFGACIMISASFYCVSAFVTTTSLLLLLVVAVLILGLQVVLYQVWCALVLFLLLLVVSVPGFDACIRVRVFPLGSQTLLRVKPLIGFSY